MVKKGERSDTYLTHDCRLLWSLERMVKKPDLSANILAFISCKSRLIIMLAVAVCRHVSDRHHIFFPFF
jgi:hypothetical protein